MIYDSNCREIHSEYAPAELYENNTTVHGFLRTVERAVSSEKQALKLISRCLAYGYPVESLPARQRNKLKRYDRVLPDGPNRIYIYKGYLFIFSNKLTLITMYEAPDLGLTYDKHGLPVKKFRKFNRLHHKSDDEWEYDMDDEN